MSEGIAQTASSADEGPILCPYCGDNVPNLLRLETGMKLRVQQIGQVSPVPDAVCNGCISVLTKMVSSGAVLRAESQAKENNRLLLWRNRVNLVKQAKSFLAQKNYSEAAVAFEKYLRVLEIVFEAKAGDLNPSLFKNDARAQELTVIASVYWDLMRIYDTHTNYAERQLKAADKLAEFVRYTAIFPHIIKKAEVQTRTAKNPEAFKRFLKKSNSSRPRCFIATSAFNGQKTDTVTRLCRFRDENLRASAFGRKLIFAYYRVSPRLALLLDRHPGWKPTVRKLLIWFAQSDLMRNSLNKSVGMLDSHSHGANEKHQDRRI